MTHEEFDACMDAYLAGGLAAPEKGSFEEHVKACDGCAKNLAAAREFARFLSGALEPHGPAEDLDERILTALRTEGFQKKKKRFRLRLPPVPRFVRAAAAAAFAVGIGAMASTPAQKKEASSGYFVGGLASLRESSESAREMDGNDMSMDGLPTDALRDQEGEEEVLKQESENLGLKRRNDLVPLRSGMEAPRSAPEELKSPQGGVSGQRNAEAGRKLSESQFGNRQDEALKDKGRREAGGGGWVGVTQGKADTPATPEASSRKVIRTGSIEIEVESFEKAHRAIVAILQEAGGFVASANTQKLANGRVRGTIVVRFPAEAFDAATLRFKDLGEVKNQAISTQDVTKLFFDTEANLRNKKTLEERLLEILKKSKGNVKELLEVEKELGNVRSEIERLEGEMKYLANQVSLSTLTLNLYEKDIGQPFEYVLTQQADVQLVTLDVPAAYERAQETLRSAGAVILSRDLQQQAQDAAYASITARVDVERFGGTVESLKKLGEAAHATISQNQRAIGGTPDKAGTDAPVRKEMATVNLSIQTPQEAVTVRATIEIESRDARAVHEAARGILGDAKAKILGGGFNRTADGEQGSITAELPPAAFHEAVARLKGLGTVKSSSMNQEEPADKAPLRREKGVITLSVRTPAPIVTEETGPAALFRKTLAGSIAGVVWSVRMLFVGVAYIGPWAALFWMVWKLARRNRKTA